MTTFIDTLNGKEGKEITRCRLQITRFLSFSTIISLSPSFLLCYSHLVTAHPGPLLSEVIMSSPIMAGEDGAPLPGVGQGFEFGIDPAEDPELAMVHTLHYYCIARNVEFGS